MSVFNATAKSDISEFSEIFIEERGEWQLWWKVDFSITTTEYTDSRQFVYERSHDLDLGVVSIIKLVSEDREIRGAKAKYLDGYVPLPSGESLDDFMRDFIDR